MRFAVEEESFSKQQIFPIGIPPPNFPSYAESGFSPKKL